jgi:hypothetical protein
MPYQLINQYETDGNKNVRIKKLENVITTVFNRHYRGGQFKWIQDFEYAFTELVLLGQTTWNSDDIKKRRLIQNSQNIGIFGSLKLRSSAVSGWSKWAWIGRTDPRDGVG